MLNFINFYSLVESIDIKENKKSHANIIKKLKSLLK